MNRNAQAEGTIAAATRMGPVELLVRDLDTMLSYYRDALALDVIRAHGSTYVLGRDGVETMTLTQERDLPARRAADAGLYHTAVVFDSEPGLAAAIVRVAQSGVGGYTGSADHLVSKAFYFDDPEGNGVELYFDRPREAWPRDAWGKPLMGVEPLDVNRYITEHVTEAELLAPSTPASVGHVHLQVGDIATARDFYAGTLGFEVTFAMGDSALFVAAGGYHHHIGMNTWHSRGAGPRAAALGLGRMDIMLPDADALAALRDRVAFAGVAVADDGRTLTFPDPWGSQVQARVEDAEGVGS